MIISFKSRGNSNFAIDTEFTGLSLNDETKNSLFDSVEDRYTKLRQSVQQFTISQIGISAFLKENDKYIAHSYNMYLFPAVFGPVDVRFMIQASSFEFQRQYDFDFNKYVYEGVSFMNEEQEKQLMAFLKRREITAGVERDIDENLVQEVCSEVAEWYTKAEVGESHTVLKNDGTRKLKYNFVFQNELRSRFEGIWTSMDEDRNLVVTKVTPEEGEKVTAKPRTDSSELHRSLTGFRRLFLLLIEQQKPLLGHNMLMDLLLIYDKFHKPLPAHYRDFKTEIHRIFPLIIDTKQISTYMIRKKIDLKFNSTLGGLYKVLSSPLGQQFVIYSPIIAHGEGFENYSHETFLPHEAGYDAYMCGYCFLRLCHIMTFMNIPSTEVVSCTFTRYLNVMKEFHNKVNIIRASVNSVNLAGSDSESQRPLVFVQSKTSSFQLSAYKLAREFSKFGTVDIRLHSRYKALVATGNIFCAKDLVQNYQNDKRMSVQYYSRWKHSPYVRPALLTGIVVSGGLCLWALWYSRKNNT
ncbi:poly(A)-specific ribonuclease PNLDC1-like isoform X2 [Ostrea edulis]|uniref:poly(A)-specific ribonuclease PNLDC1-like isoform X2 n=1 Tax=Ostrea edulis TaxID=37623 RepID=UPI0024AF6BF5|nr:poly(A)-specific ribonuclease PNLDC1-like isoform X2 [Ostrea edulis]